METKNIKYIGGPKNGQKAWKKLSDFPELFEGGEYHHSGFSYGYGARAPEDSLPEAPKSSARWVPMP